MRTNIVPVITGALGKVRTNIVPVITGALGKVRTNIVPVIIGALGKIKKGLDQNIRFLPGHPSAIELQKVTLMSTAQHIICEVLG